MLNLSRIQLELDKAKEGLREVEETIQKVEGKGFSNGPGRYSGLKVELHSDKGRNQQLIDDAKIIRRRIVTNSDSRNQRISSDDLSYTLKRGPRDKREGGPPPKRQPQSIFARLSGIVRPKPADDEEEDDFQHKKPSLSSRVITTSAEAPSRQEVIAAQTADEKSKQRNKRMFSALVGTLQRFRKEETRDREREEKRQKVEKKLEEDAKREREKLMQEKRELFLERKRREVEIKRIEWSLNRVKEYEAWEANVLPLKNFIQTQAKPHIFYLPRSHNHKTEEKLAHSQKIVEKMIEKRKTNLKEEIENSERKARRTVAEVAEEAEEEEAENIPQDDDDHQVVEQQMEIDFDAMDKENGYHEDGSKENLENMETVVEQDETIQDSTIDEKPDQENSNPKEELQETVTMENEDDEKINEINDDEGGGEIADDGGGPEPDDDEKPENDTDTKKDESDSNIATEVPISESETKNVENKPEDLVTEKTKPDEINLPNEEQPNVSEDKPAGKKEGEASRRGYRSRSRKGTKRSRSSRSPRRSRSRTRSRRSRKSRSRSRRRTMRRRSRSVSVSSPKKSRRSGSGRRRTDRKRSNSKSPSPKRQTKSRASSHSSKTHSD